MDEKIVLFTYNEKELRTVVIDGEPWWVAKDICEILDLSDVSMSLSRLDEDEKGTSSICTPGGEQEMSIVSESGLYSLTLGSKKPEARPFKRWITHEVLPSLRKTGEYSIGARDQSVLPSTARRFEKRDDGRLQLRKNWINYMLSVLENTLGLSKNEMLHQSYEGMERDSGIRVDDVRQHYMEAGGEPDCSALDAVLRDRDAFRELSEILEANMKIVLVKQFR